MKEIRRHAEIPVLSFDKCHDGEGVVLCRSLLDDMGSRKLAFMHSDDMPAGVSIGEHEHTNNEEIYYLVSGRGVLTFDGVKYEMNPGDISLCGDGHSHGFLATEDRVLIVVGSR